VGLRWWVAAEAAAAAAAGAGPEVVEAGGVASG
jgi:hypothetical protein